MRDFARRRRWQIACAVLLLWALVASVHVALYRLHAVNVGSAAEWATAAVSLLALAAAVWAGLAAHGQLTLMHASVSVDAARRRREEVEETLRRERGLEAWLGVTMEGDPTDRVRTIRVRNGGQGHAADVSLWIIDTFIEYSHDHDALEPRFGNGQGLRFIEGLIPPGAERSVEVVIPDLDVKQLQIVARWADGKGYKRLPSAPMITDGGSLRYDPGPAVLENSERSP
jgi:hypothetical protein